MATAARTDDPPAWVYLLRCRDGSLYTGWTTDLDRRLARHRAGTASRYTSSRLPVVLALAVAMESRTAARREEARIKRLSRRAKLTLLEGPRSDVRQQALTPAELLVGVVDLPVEAGDRRLGHGAALDLLGEGAVGARDPVQA